jgi:hypothetical protein
MIENWLKLSDRDKTEVFIQTSNQMGLPPAAIEKDWWVIMILRALFNSEISNHLLFKGGTSLSKSWGLIERFSEDVDLAINRDYFGYGGELNKTKIKKLRKAACTFASTALPEILKGELRKIGVLEFQLSVLPFEDSDTDPIAIEVAYPALTEKNKYLTPRVLVEISARSLIEPFELRNLQSFVSETYSDAGFADPIIQIPSVHPKRTFLEKIFLLHEEFQKPEGKPIISNRKTRHLYDLSMIMETEHYKKAINDTGLYKAIIVHREKFNHISWVDYKTLLPKTIAFIPPKSEMDNWKKDYQDMSESMFYGDTISFEELISRLNGLQEEIRKIKL